MSPERFRAMGVDVVVGGAHRAEVDAVRELFDLWERTFSPFRADSELTRVNRGASPSGACSPLFARGLAIALAAADATDGLGDPRFAGDSLDLNGVVKGLAVDEAVALVAGDGFVSAGGDVCVRGSAVVGLPGGGALRLRDGGLATSGTTRRPDHLVDPRTGRPSASRWSEVTVAADTCLAADVAAKAAFLLSGEGPDWLDARGLAGRFRAGSVTVTNRVWQDAMQLAEAA